MKKSRSGCFPVALIIVLFVAAGMVRCLGSVTHREPGRTSIVAPVPVSTTPVTLHASELEPIELGTPAPPPTPEPSATPLPSDTPESTPTPPATDAPTATLGPSHTPAPKTTVVSNLRSGPGTVFSIVGRAEAGDPLEIVARNEAGDWYQLANEAWIYAPLVNAPPEVGVAEVIPTPPPPTDTPVPPTPTQVIVAYPTPVPAAPPARSCCRVCTTGKACGDSCISRSKTCHKGAGCACNG